MLKKTDLKDFPQIGQSASSPSYKKSMKRSFVNWKNHVYENTRTNNMSRTAILILKYSKTPY